MTLDEAIKILEELKDSDYPKYSEALETAIRSLEAWELVKVEIEKKSEITFNKSYWGESAGLNMAINIIDKHLLEVS